jgi:hypothetical protein
MTEQIDLEQPTTDVPGPRPPGTGGWFRVLVLLAAVALGGVGCSVTVGGVPARSSTPEKGGCVSQAPGNTYRTEDCTSAGATFRVLKVLDQAASSEDCYDVAGAEGKDYDATTDTFLCLGPVDVDPRTAVNVAQPGDCVTDVEASEVKRVSCTDPTAAYRVLHRVEDGSPLGTDCGDVIGSSVTWSWSFQSGLGLDRKVVFCLAPKALDPAQSLDAAKVGDCLAPSTPDIRYTRVDCAAPEAMFRVLDRSETNLFDVQTFCNQVPGATRGLKNTGALINGYVLCLGPV